MHFMEEKEENNSTRNLACNLTINHQISFIYICEWRSILKDFSLFLSFYIQQRLTLCLFYLQSYHLRKAKQIWDCSAHCVCLYFIRLQFMEPSPSDTNHIILI